MTTSHHTSLRTTPLRLGILGCANIAKQFARDVHGSKQVAIQAVASRDLAKAQAFADIFHIARAHGSYEALLADAALDAIYLPLPNSMHAEWAIRAMQAGKHVLCEKPLALNLAEVTRMFANTSTTPATRTRPLGATCRANCVCARALPTAFRLKKCIPLQAVVFALPQKPLPTW